MKDCRVQRVATAAGIKRPACSAEDEAACGCPEESLAPRATGPRCVVLESPYRGRTPADTAANVDYAKAALRDCIDRGEAPIASHLLIAAHHVLDDASPEERARGIAAGLAWTPRADAVVVYTDRGVSEGMAEGVRKAIRAGVPVEYRRLDPAGLAPYQLRLLASASDGSWVPARQAGKRRSAETLALLDQAKRAMCDPRYWRDREPAAVAEVDSIVAALERSEPAPWTRYLCTAAGLNGCGNEPGPDCPGCWADPPREG